MLIPAAQYSPRYVTDGLYKTADKGPFCNMPKIPTTPEVKAKMQNAENNILFFNLNHK